MKISELESELKKSSAYAYPEGKRAIDKALPKMYEAEAVAKTDEVSRITQKLTEELERILATLAPPSFPEAAELLRDFETQFGERLNELDAFGIIDKANPKITGIDNKEYAPPSWEQIKAALTSEKLRLIAQLENPTLLLVPDGMSLSEYVDKAGKDKPAPKRKLPWNNATDIDLDADKRGKLISDAATYDKTNHRGKTKMERLAEPGALGWQVFVVDGGDEVPESTLGKTADDLLTRFRAQGFSGLSVEAIFALQMHGQVRGKQFDTQKYGWLLESYLTSLGSRGVVLCSGWNGSHVRLIRYGSGDSFGAVGVRRSVRVL